MRRVPCACTRQEAAVCRVVVAVDPTPELVLGAVGVAQKIYSVCVGLFLLSAVFVGAPPRRVLPFCIFFKKKIYVY